MRRGFATGMDSEVGTSRHFVALRVLSAIGATGDDHEHVTPLAHSPALLLVALGFGF
jgi:hypothetical protein